MEIKMDYAKQRNFKFANKLGKQQACKLCKEEEKKVMSELQEGNTVITDNANVHKLFHQYSILYKGQEIALE